jgi:assimilatory nitrate reductase catalytic subunit
MTARAKLAGLLRRWDGPLTHDLSLQPGRFGLGKVPARLAPDATTAMICGYCSTGCSLDVHLRDGWAINLSPTADYPVNRGMACPKGWEALAPLAAPDRATRPLLRSDRGRLEPVSWDEALRAFVRRIRAIQEAHGPASVAFLGTGQLPSEELALLGALAKFGMGMVHGDGNTRQCMATAAVAYKQSFGFDAPPYSYQDLEESDVIVLWGSNLCIAHPILWERVCRNPHRPAIIVVDPRRTETAMAATRHVALRPKSDLVLLYGLARVLIERGWIDRGYIDAHTRGFDELRRHVQSYTLDQVCETSGLAPAEIVSFAETIGRGARVSLWWTMGVNQSHEGVLTAQGLINLALMTGNIGRPGTGANSITGQCNAMGSRLFANTTNLLGGHDFANPAHRAKVGRVLDIDEARIPREAGWAYDQILDGVRTGAIKALWIVGTNTAHSWIDQHALDEIFSRLELVVVQDLYATTETARRADLVLPAAGWGEKEGTFINSERRIGLIKRVARSPGEALPDFDIFRLVAAYWGCGEMFRRWESPEQVFRLLATLSVGQPCDFSGIRDYRMIDEAGGIQWPLPEGTALAGPERRLLADGAYFTPDRRARFLVGEPSPVPETPCADYPLLLLTGRGSSSQWHTLSRTGKSAVLRELAPRHVYIALHPDDARRLGVLPGEQVAVRSRRGEITARAFITRTLQPGHVFAPMHYEETNRLTFPAFDPHSRQPSYKACAVDVRPLPPPERRTIRQRSTTG